MAHGPAGSLLLPLRGTVASGSDLTVSCSVKVGVVSLAGGAVPEVSAATRALVGVSTASGSASPNVSASSLAAVGVQTKSGTTVDISFVSLALVGVQLHSLPSTANDVSVSSLGLVGVRLHAGGALAEISFAGQALVGVQARAGALPEPLASSLVEVGVQTRSGGANPSITGSALALVGIQTRSGGATWSVSVPSLLEVGVQARADGALYDITVTPNRLYVGTQLYSVQQSDKTVEARLYVGVQTRPFGPFVASAAIVLNRMIGLGYASTPITQDLVDRRMNRGGMEPPTNPPERRDFFDVRRGSLTIDQRVEYLEANAGLIVTGSYTPTLVGVVVGSGGTNGANYTYIGGPDVGDSGLLTVEGEIVFGSSGQTFPAATVTVTLPSQFVNVEPAALREVGWWSANDSGATYQGWMRPTGTTTLRFILPNVTGTQIPHAATGTTSPFTWGTGDKMTWNAHGLRVVRV